MNNPTAIAIERPQAPPLTLLDFEHGITAIDTEIERPLFDASHLLVEGDRAAFVDVGTRRSVPNLQAVLELKQIDPAAVDYVIVTHVHPEHAGGAGELIRQLPNARLVVHAGGARHLVDPSGLPAADGPSSEIAPAPAERIQPAEDGMVLELNGRALRVIDTPGHPRHHFCLYDERSRSIFSGDTFGVSYRDFDTEQGAFIFPCTAALRFEPRALHAAIDRLLDYQPEAMFLTHYSRVCQVPRLAAELHIQIDRLAAMTQACHGFGDRRERLVQSIEAFLLMGLAAHGCPLHPDNCRELLAHDVQRMARELEGWLDGGPRRH